MKSLVAKNYVSRITAYKDILISELTDEFGSQYKELLDERFDKIKFVFFISLSNYKKYLRNKYSYLAATKIAEFIKDNDVLKDVHVSNEYRATCGYIIKSENEELFWAIFGEPFLSFDFQNDYERVFGIYSFDSVQDYNLLSSYAHNKNTTLEQFINDNRCDFLRSIGKYPANYTNEMIRQDQNYSELCRYYEQLMKQYNSILAKVKESLKSEIDIFNKFKSIRGKIFISGYKEMLKRLSIYLSEEDKKRVSSNNYTLDEIDFLNVFFNPGQNLNEESKIEVSSEERQELFSSYYGEYDQNKCDVLAEKVKAARENSANRYNRQILKAFVFETNCDISDIECDHDISISDATLFASFEQENGEGKDRLIFFDPYVTDEGNDLDIHLRHELRHSLTSSVRKEGNLDVVKIGNAEYTYLDGELISTNNVFYNELFTQKIALENTRISYEKGIYILSPDNSPFPEEKTSIYDQYLPEFEKVYGLLPQKALSSQIEENNGNLYSFITVDEMKQLETALYEYNVDDVLYSILKPDSTSKLIH